MFVNKTNEKSNGYGFETGFFSLCSCLQFCLFESTKKYQVVSVSFVDI